MRQLHSGACQGVEIEGTFGSRGLAGKADETGDQRFGAADILADLCGKRPLIVSERRAEEHVGITEHGGDGIVEFVGGAADQLTDGGQFFGLKDLGLQTVQVFERFLRVIQEADQFAIEKMLAPENHDAHEECCGQS